MDQNKDQDFSSTPIPFRNHTALLLGVALPFLQPAYRHPVELALKFLEFTETLRLFREFHIHGNSSPFPQQDFSFAENNGFFGILNRYVTDLEGLLISLSRICTGDEKELIGMFLNLIRARNFYDMYGDLLKSQFADENGLAGLFSSLSGFGSPLAEAASHQQANSESLSAPASFVPDLSGMLNTEQKETLDLLKSLFSDEL